VEEKQRAMQQVLLTGLPVEETRREGLWVASEVWELVVSVSVRAADSVESIVATTTT